MFELLFASVAMLERQSIRVKDFVDTPPFCLDVARKRIYFIENNTVQIWNLSPFKYVRSYSFKRKVLSMALSRNGQYLVAGTEGRELKVWDTNSNKSIFYFAEMPWFVHDVDINSDGNLVAAISYDTIYVFDLNAKKVFAKKTGAHHFGGRAILFGHNDYLFSAAMDQSIRYWKAPLFNNMELFRSEKFYRKSPLDTFFDLFRREKVKPMRAHFGPVYDLELSSDLKFLLSVGRGDTRIEKGHIEAKFPTAKIWNIDEKREVWNYTFPYGIKQGAFIDGNRTLLLSGTVNQSYGIPLMLVIDMRNKEIIKQINFFDQFVSHFKYMEKQKKLMVRTYKDWFILYDFLQEKNLSFFKFKGSDYVYLSPEEKKISFSMDEAYWKDTALISESGVNDSWTKLSGEKPKVELE